MEYIPWAPHLFFLGAIAAGVLGIIGGLALTLFSQRGHLGPYEYHVWRWEASNVLGSAFSLISIGDEREGESAEKALLAYFSLTSAIRNAEDTAEADLPLIEALTNERYIHENDVERIIESRLSEAVSVAGLERGLPFFNGVTMVWPPVDIELTSPPRVLVRSPRNEILRKGDTLLRDDITLAEVEDIEARVDDEETISLIIAIGGVAVYPALVRDDRSYDGLLSTAAHEWVHHYLAFYPLGEQWGKGGDAETLNETTADIAGDAIAAMVRAAHPVEFPPGEDGRKSGGPDSTIDFNSEMRALRLKVDELLAAGRIEEAEQLMEETRLRLAENGIVIRKINQAYFAFYGTYAENPASSNPVGPMIRQVWERSGDVGTFLRIMREVTSRPDLESVLLSMGGTVPTE